MLGLRLMAKKGLDAYGQRYEISVIIAQKHAKSADFGIKIAIISEK
jgi:hypothetical protein